MTNRQTPGKIFSRRFVGSNKLTINLEWQTRIEGVRCRGVCRRTCALRTPRRDTTFEISRRAAQHTATRLCAVAVHAFSALSGDAGCTSAVDGDLAGEVVSVAPAPAPSPVRAVLPAAAAACALATMAANDVLGAVRSVGNRAAAVDGKTGSWNTLATLIYNIHPTKLETVNFNR